MALKIELQAIGPGVIQLGGVKDQRIVKPGEKFVLEDGKEANWMVKQGVAVLVADAEPPKPVKGAKITPTVTQE